ncbi:MAG: enoyl-CoA hydratase/isomerase family protein [Acidobacteria bacterium]|nr:enoyl-CoA hydratase/isomerase family protein [Acidobacteriota bacterium]
MDEIAYGKLICRKTGNYAVVDLADALRDEPSVVQTAPDLVDLCDRIALDERVRVIVLCFDGGTAFISQAGRGERISLVDAVAGLRQPVIGAIRGDAIGLGLELALACDIRIGMDNSRFSLPQVQKGCMPSDGGTQRLPRLIGRSRAMHMILTGESVDAGEAFRWGLINRIVPAGELLSAAVEMAREMAENSPVSLSYAKEALWKGMDLTLEQGIRMELDLYLHLFTTSDRTEGIAAYKEKRKPRFEGI